MAERRVASDALIKALYGRPLRLRLATWIVERRGEQFFLQEAQDALRATGDASSAVPKELESFVALDMLREFRNGQRRYFAPLASPHWRAFAAIAQACGLRVSNMEGVIDGRRAKIAPPDRAANQ